MEEDDLLVYNGLKVKNRERFRVVVGDHCPIYLAPYMMRSLRVPEILVSNISIYLATRRGSVELLYIYIQ